MTYPLVQEYIAAILMAEDNFATLTNLRPVLDNNSEPIMSSGNFAVVFKMEDITTREVFAVKCFTKNQEGRNAAYKTIANELSHVDSPYFVKIKYLEKEIFVNSSVTSEEEFPVVVMNWVEGLTLDQYVRKNIDDRYALEVLSYCFCQLAYWMVQQPFAHGDLKPDNIIVRNNGMLTLVDYDGMYVPEMFDQKSREIGSPNFRHPNRSTSDFDSHIDDLPLISIALALRMMWIDKKWFEDFSDSDHFIFQSSDYANIIRSDIFQDLFDSVSDRITLGLINLLLHVCKNNSIIEKDYNKFVYDAPDLTNGVFVDLYMQMAKIGNLQMQALYGFCLCEGKIIEKRPFDGIILIFDSVNKGCVRAENILGNFYDGKDIEKSIEWYLKAAEHGYQIAQYNLGNCYYLGTGVDKNYSKAVEWYAKAAEQGDSWAQYCLGNCYYFGEGVEKDFEKAFFWYRKSAEQGNPDAEDSLADCYQFGEGITEDRAKAVEWYTKSAEQGNSWAQCSLGICYEGGLGVVKDYRMAVKWYKESAKHGNTDAQYNLA